MSKSTLIIFDNDGTLADVLPVVLDYVNPALQKAGVLTIPEGRFSEYRNYTPRQIVNKLEIPFYKIPKVVSLIRKELLARSSGVAAVSGMPDLVRDLSQIEDVYLVVISTSLAESVNGFLDRNKILEAFDSVYSDVSVLGKSRHMKRIMKKYQSVDQVLAIGDEVRDIRAANKVGAVSIAVTWGLNDTKILKRQSPDFIIDTPNQLRDKILAMIDDKM